jgi:branched-chain amino acid transport system permease protein
LPPLPNPLSLVEGIWNSFVTKRSDWIDLPNWPTKIGLGSGRMPLAAAFVIALAFAALLGFLFHVLIFRPLRHAPPLAKVVASVGLFLLLINIITLRFTGTFKPVAEPDLGKRALKPFGNDIVIQREQLVAAGLVLIVTIVLTIVFKRTRFGLATRAAAENEKGAVVLGFSPEFLAGANWVLSTVVAGTFGILVSAITGLDPVTLPFLIIPALGAALLGSFSSFTITAFAGLGIGMIQALTKTYTAKSWFPREWIPQSGLEKALPFFVIIIVLFVRGKSLPQRGSVSAGRLPFAPRPTRVLWPTLLCSAGALLVVFAFRYDWRQAAINTLVGTAIALSLVVITGYVGQISLAQAALAGVAGFAMSKFFQSWLPFPFAPLAGALVAAGFGLLVALPALRVRGVNLAVVTLAAALAIEELVFKNAKLAGHSGVLSVAPPKIFGSAVGPGNAKLEVFGIRALQDPNVPPSAWFGVVCLVTVVLLAAMVANVRRSGTGRRFLAVRSNERAAAAAGVSVAGTKLLAFGLSAFIAGIGGALSGYRFGSVAPSNFGALASITLLAFAYLGGISSVGGAIAAGLIGVDALVFTLLEKRTGIDPKYTVILGAVGLIFTAIQNPEGISGAVRLASARFRQRRPRAAVENRPAVAVQTGVTV